MKPVSNKVRSIKAAIISVVYIVLAFFYYYIDVYLAGWLVFITAFIIGLAVILMVVGVVRQLILVVKNRHNLNLGYFLPAVIYLFFLLLPIGEVEDYLSPVKFRACYEGMHGASVIYFRNDQSLQVHTTGFFAYSQWQTGKWQQKRDTIFLSWDSKVYPYLGNRLLIDSGYLRPLDGSGDEVRLKQRMFYLGYCKGQN